MLLLYLIVISVIYGDYNVESAIQWLELLVETP